MILESFKSFNKELYSEEIVYGVEVLKGLKPDQEFGTFQLRENMRLIVEEYDTEITAPENSLFEIHDYTLDIQYPISGYEMTYFTAKEALTIASEYQEEKDRTHYSIPKGNNYSQIVTGNTIFAVYYPGDPHSPKKAAGNNVGLIKKATIKILGNPNK